MNKHIILALLILFFLNAPVSAIEIIPHQVNWGYENATNRTINNIVIHRSYDAAPGHDPHNFGGVLKEWHDGGVIPHYAIAYNGTIYQFVNDSDVAYQAGKGTMNGSQAVANWNLRSIGIELIYNGSAEGPSQQQYESLGILLKKLTAEHKQIRLIVGHDTIARWRGKTDPENLDWFILFDDLRPNWNLIHTEIAFNKTYSYQTSYMSLEA